MSNASRNIVCLKVVLIVRHSPRRVAPMASPGLPALEGPATPAWLREVPALEILRRVWIQQFYASAGPVQWQSLADLPPAALLIQSPHDVEARYGVKRTTTWTGDIRSSHRNL
jgi:hypothetical protein